MKQLLRPSIFMLFALLLGNAFAQTAPKLLPFQGRLTDQNGVAVSNGVRLVQFKIYDVPTGGASVWAGEVHKTTVNGGLVNLVLGSKTPFTGVDFDKTLYLEITVDINGDSAITVADPPMLPRQIILPAVFAKESADSRLLVGSDWRALFGTNSPNGPLLSSKIGTNSISGSQIAPQSVSTTHIANNAITSNQIAPGSIDLSKLLDRTITGSKLAVATLTSNEIAIGTIPTDRLANRAVGTNVPVGGVAISRPTGNPSASGAASSPKPIENLQVTISTTGRPVYLFLTGQKETPPGSEITASGFGLTTVNIGLQRGATSLGWQRRRTNLDNWMQIPTSSFVWIDTPPPGQHTYQVMVQIEDAITVDFYEVSLVAFEL